MRLSQEADGKDVVNSRGNVRDERTGQKTSVTLQAGAAAEGLVSGVPRVLDGRRPVRSVATPPPAPASMWATGRENSGEKESNKDAAVQGLSGICFRSPYTLEKAVARNYLVKERPTPPTTSWTARILNATSSVREEAWRRSAVHASSHWYCQNYGKRQISRFYGVNKNQEKFGISGSSKKSLYLSSKPPSIAVIWESFSQYRCTLSSYLGSIDFIYATYPFIFSSCK